MLAKLDPEGIFDLEGTILVSNVKDRSIASKLSLSMAALSFVAFILFEWNDARFMLTRKRDN